MNEEIKYDFVNLDFSNLLDVPTRKSKFKKKQFASSEN
jgi:hypothetical protein